MNANRRRHVRYLVDPGYTPIAVRLYEDDDYSLTGHAYNISEGGCCFEIDVAIEPGTSVGLRITIPGRETSPTGKHHAFVLANVVWVGDPDEPGPVQHAAAFRHFAREGDQEELMEALASGRFAVAA